jgi:DNA repair photolyase
MGLNESKGNMYDFVTHTWNTIKGKCFHDCSYCYMKRFGNLKPVRFDEKELKTDLGNGNFIFVGSSCDMFATDIPEEWILKTLKHCEKHDIKYLFQTKNPERFMDFIHASVVSNKSVLCTTIESNRWYTEIMGKSPHPEERARWMSEIDCIDKYVTIEPILDFDVEEMVELIKKCNPVQVNIGADSGGNRLPEPSWDKVQLLITELNKFTVISRKKNLDRLARQEAEPVS